MRTVNQAMLGMLAGIAISSGGAFGADRMRNPAADWESLPSIRTGVKIWSHTSKSPLNVTIMDWTNYTTQDKDGYELALAKGDSGMFIHCWAAWHGGPRGDIRLYLSDNPYSFDITAAAQTKPLVPVKTETTTDERLPAIPDLDDPSSVAGLQLWLDASDVDGDGNQANNPADGTAISKWADKSNNHNDAVQGTGTTQPLLKRNVINGHPALRFDGTDDWLKFNNIADIRTIFWVMKEDADATGGGRFLLGDDNSYHFHRGASDFLWESKYASPNICGGVTRIDGAVVQGGEASMPTDYSVISLVTTGNVEASQITRDREVAGRFWDGDICEILIYNTALSNSDRGAVEAYLQKKWLTAPLTPQINVQVQGVDIASGDTTPGTSDDTDFGVTAVGKRISKTFTIQNRGTADLVLDDSPISVELSGDGAGAFTVTSQPSSPIAALGSSAFTIEFDAKYSGVVNATVSIANNAKADVKPDHDMPFQHYFDVDKSLSKLWRKNQFSHWAFPCLPYDSEFRAMITKAPNWYQYTLHRYRERRFAETFTDDDIKVLESKYDLDEKGNSQSSTCGQFPGAEPGNLIESRALDIAGLETQTVLDVQSAGVVRSIKLELPTIESKVVDNVYIRMITDGEVTAELPVSMFFGGYRNVDMNNAKGIPAGYDGKHLYCFFPMPFWESMKIELIAHRNGDPIRVQSEIGWSDSNSYPRDSTGVFKVKFNENGKRKPGEPDCVNLDVKGSGVLVGCVARLTGAIEANFSTFTDGSKTPVVECTGGEDHFNHAYGISRGVCNPFSGGLAESIGYRFNIIDYVPFLNSLKITQDHARFFTHDKNGNFLNAYYYYHTPKQFLVETDHLDVGNRESELAHGYRIAGTKGRVRLQTDTGAYEGPYDEPISDEGRWTDKESRFTVKINPDNDGVRLRKRINQTAYHQEIDVYVNEVKAGAWFEQGANYAVLYGHKEYREEIEAHYAAKHEEVPTWENGKMPSKFRDTEFEIPAALTKGKAILDIRMVTKGSLAVKAADEGLTNEYRYWIYSYASTVSPK